MRNHSNAEFGIRNDLDSHLLVYREDVRDSDLEDVRGIVKSCGFFYDDEVNVAVELVEERLRKGPGSGYFFIFAEQTGTVVAYSCFGPIACTRASYDLYWIAVHDRLRGRGLGRKLLGRTEKAIEERGGRRIYVETSSRAQYEPTRMFYVRCGYLEEAVLRDYYAPGDGKVIYVKAID